VVIAADGHVRSRRDQLYRRTVIGRRDAPRQVSRQFSLRVLVADQLRSALRRSPTHVFPLVSIGFSSQSPLTIEERMCTRSNTSTTRFRSLSPVQRIGGQACVGDPLGTSRCVVANCAGYTPPPPRKAHHGTQSDTQDGVRSRNTGRGAVRLHG